MTPLPLLPWAGNSLFQMPCEFIIWCTSDLFASRERSYYVAIWLSKSLSSSCNILARCFCSTSATFCSTSATNTGINIWTHQRTLCLRFWQLNNFQHLSFLPVKRFCSQGSQLWKECSPDSWSLGMNSRAEGISPPNLLYKLVLRFSFCGTYNSLFQLPNGDASVFQSYGRYIKFLLVFNS